MNTYLLPMRKTTVEGSRPARKNDWGGPLAHWRKLPSVRRLSQEQGISISTAFQAYYQLERKGLIEARPKSGYYVRYNPTRFPAMPSILEKEHREEQVTVAEMIDTVYRNVRAEV